MTDRRPYDRCPRCGSEDLAFAVNQHLRPTEPVGDCESCGAQWWADGTVEPRWKEAVVTLEGGAFHYQLDCYLWSGDEAAVRPYMTAAQIEVWQAYSDKPLWINTNPSLLSVLGTEVQAGEHRSGGPQQITVDGEDHTVWDVTLGLDWTVVTDGENGDEDDRGLAIARLSQEVLTEAARLQCSAWHLADAVLDNIKRVLKEGFDSSAEQRPTIMRLYVTEGLEAAAKQVKEMLADEHLRVTGVDADPTTEWFGMTDRQLVEAYLTERSSQDTDAETIAVLLWS